MSATTTFLAALRIEAFALRLGAPSARVISFGMGERKAEAAASRLLQLPVGPVVLFGFSGALDNSLHPGDLVVATELGFVALDETVALPNAKEIAKQLESRGLRVVTAPVVTSRRLVVGDEARAKAAADGAVAVDMESWSFASLARDRHFAVIRAIVDAPGREVRSASTPLAAIRAAVALGRAARVMQQSTTLFEVPMSNEQSGEI